MVDLMADGLAQRLASLVSAVFRRHSFQEDFGACILPARESSKGKPTATRALTAATRLRYKNAMKNVRSAIGAKK